MPCGHRIIVKFYIYKTYVQYKSCKAVKTSDGAWPTFYADMVRMW